MIPAYGPTLHATLDIQWLLVVGRQRRCAINYNSGAFHEQSHVCGPATAGNLRHLARLAWTVLTFAV